MKRTIDRIGRQRLVLFLIFVFTGLIAHFELYSNHLTNPDGLSIGMWYNSKNMTLQLGRWGIYYIETIRGYLCPPIIISFLAIIYMSISSLLIIQFYDIKNFYSQLSVGIIFIVSPAMAQTLSYYYRSDTYMLAMLFACISAYFLASTKLQHNLLGIIFLILMLSIYQSYIGVTCILLLSNLLFDLLQENKIKNTIIKLLRYLIAGIISLTIYYLIANFFLIVHNLTFSSYSGADKGPLAGLLVWKNSLFTIYKNFEQFILGDNVYLIKNKYWNRSVFNSTFLLIVLIKIIFIILRKKIYHNIIKTLFILLNILLLPLSMCIIRFITPEHNYELLMSAPLYFIFPIGITILEVDMEKISSNCIEFINKSLKYLLPAGLILVAIINWTYLLSDNATYLYLNKLQSRATNIAQNMCSRIGSIENYKKDMPLLIAGRIDEENYPFNNVPKIKELKDAAIGQISEWDFFWPGYGGTKNGWYCLFREHLGQSIKFCTDKEYVNIVNSEEFFNMGTFPDNDSIRIINNIVVIKLTQNPDMPN